MCVYNDPKLVIWSPGYRSRLAFIYRIIIPTAAAAAAARYRPKGARHPDIYARDGYIYDDVESPPKILPGGRVLFRTTFVLRTPSLPSRVVYLTIVPTEHRFARRHSCNVFGRRDTGRLEIGTGTYIHL